MCPFCEVIAGRADGHVVLDDEVAVAFLDRRPVFKGHVLVVPRQHVVTLPDLDPGDVDGLFRRVQLIAAAMPDALGCDGTFVAINNVVSQSVAHLHVHVVPRRRKDGLRGFFWPRTTYADAADAERYAAPLRAALGHGIPDAVSAAAQRRRRARQAKGGALPRPEHEHQQMIRIGRPSASWPSSPRTRCSPRS